MSWSGVEKGRGGEGKETHGVESEVGVDAVFESEEVEVHSYTTHGKSPYSPINAIYQARHAETKGHGQKIPESVALSCRVVPGCQTDGAQNGMPEDCSEDILGCDKEENTLPCP